MATQVLLPSSDPAPQKKERESDLDKIMKGLQIAATGFGIYTDYQKLGMMKEQQDIAKDKAGRDATMDELTIDEAKAKKSNREGLANSIISPENEIDLLNKGFQKVDKPVSGGLDVFIKRSSDKEPEKVYFMTPSQVELKAKKIEQMLDSEEKSAANKLKASDTEFDRENKLRDEYNLQSKATEESLANYNIIKDASTGRLKGVSDMSLLYTWLKVLDPGARVTDSDFQNARETQALPDQVRQMRDQLISGGKLGPEARQLILQDSKNAIKSRLSIQLERDRRYTELSQRSNVQPEDVINGIFAQRAKEIETEGASNKPRAGVSAPSVLNTFPRTVTNPKTGLKATVSNQAELEEAMQDGFR